MICYDMISDNKIKWNIVIRIIKINKIIVIVIIIICIYIYKYKFMINCVYTGIYDMI